MPSEADKLNLKRIASGGSPRVSVPPLPKVPAEIKRMRPKEAAAWEQFDAELELWRKKVFGGGAGGSASITIQQTITSPGLVGSGATAQPISTTPPASEAGGVSVSESTGSDEGLLALSLLSLGWS